MPPSFHALLAESIRHPGAVEIDASYSSRLYCAPAARPGVRWHVVESLDTPGLYRADGPCPHPEVCTHKKS